LTSPDTFKFFLSLSSTSTCFDSDDVVVEEGLFSPADAVVLALVGVPILPLAGDGRGLVLVVVAAAVAATAVVVLEEEEDEGVVVSLDGGGGGGAEDLLK
jgi:hypothetical protein